MKIKHHILVAITPLVTSCSFISDTVDHSLTWVVKKPKTNVTKGEQLIVKPIIADKSITPMSQKSGGFVGGKVLSYALDELEQGVSNSANRFSSTYSFRYVGKDLTVVKGFNLERRIDYSKKKQLASQITLAFENLGTHDQGVANIQLDKILIHYPKSAIARWDKDVDLIINIKISTYDSESSKMVTIVDSSLTAKGCELNTVKQFDDVAQKPRTSWFSIPSGTEQSHQAPYVITVTVNEIANFYKTAEKGKTLLSDNKDKIKSKLGDIF